jgi:hypothetical protein
VASLRNLRFIHSQKICHMTMREYSLTVRISRITDPEYFLSELPSQKGPGTRTSVRWLGPF